MTHRTSPQDICGWQYATPGSLRWLHGLCREIAKEMPIDHERVRIESSIEHGTVEVRIVDGTARECIAFLALLNEDLPIPLFAVVRGTDGASVWVPT